MRLWIGLLLGLAAAAGITTALLQQQTDNSPPANLEPNRVAHHPLTFVAQLKNDPQAGKKIYHEYCAHCHAAQPEIEINAPRTGHPKDWARFSHLTQQTLLQMAIQGYNAMPARGGCFECSDQQLKQAIDYMLSRSSRDKTVADR